jgi:uncharacterized protein (DUF169 family)
MDLHFRNKFQKLWEQYFGSAELPIIFFYSDEAGAAEPGIKAGRKGCFIGELAKVRKGRSLAFNQEAVSCGGGKKYLGFSDNLRPGFEYFLSCGNTDMEGERYLQSPELVKKFLQNAPWVPAKASKIVFKRWDNLTENDKPEVVIFFATPDVLSGLYTLSGYDRDDLHGNIAPFGAGCASIVQYPLLESKKEKPAAVIGMFDVSARPYLQENVLTFAVPFKRIVEVVSFMDESFLITNSWQKVRKRINR